MQPSSKSAIVALQHGSDHHAGPADPEAVRACLADEVGPALERGCSIVDGRRVHLRLAEGEAQLRKVSNLVSLAARRLEEDGGADPPVDIAERPLGVGVERLRVRMLAGDVRVDRGNKARLA